MCWPSLFCRSNHVVPSNTASSALSGDSYTGSEPVNTASSALSGESDAGSELESSPHLEPLRPTNPPLSVDSASDESDAGSGPEPPPRISSSPPTQFVSSDLAPGSIVNGQPPAAPTRAQQGRDKKVRFADDSGLSAFEGPSLGS